MAFVSSVNDTDKSAVPSPLGDESVQVMIVCPMMASQDRTSP